MGTSSYNLVICELYNPKIHGITRNSSSNIHGQFLVHTSFNMDDFMEDEWIDLLDTMRSQYASYPEHFKTHHHIRNYKNIVDNNNYFKLDIVKMIELEGGETIGIIKTKGLKRLQKQFKRKFYETKN